MNIIQINGMYYHPDSEDYRQLIIETLGIDFYNHIQSLNTESVYQEKRFNSDMINYESQIEEYRTMLSDTVDTLRILRDDISDSKRINKDNIINTLSRIYKDINANL